MVGFGLTRSLVASVAGRELDGLSVVSLACGECCHRGLRKVAAGDGPFVVLVGEDGADEADRDGVVGEDADDVGATFDGASDLMVG